MMPIQAVPIRSVEPATRSPSGDRKAHTRQHDDGTPVHSFRTLLGGLDTIVTSTFSVGTDAAITLTNRPDTRQQRALDLPREIAAM